MSRLSIVRNVVLLDHDSILVQMFKRSKTLYFPKGKIIADGRDSATGMMIITQGSVCVELPLDSDEADEQMGKENSVALYALGRG